MKADERNRERDAPAWDGRMVSLRGIAFRACAKGGVPLSMQLVAAVKSAVVRRKFRAGDVLPSIRELSDACGTSAKVPRRALDILEAEGWTRPVRGVGSIVLDRGEDARSNGRILFYVRQTGYSYYCAELLAVIDARLVAKGWKTFVVNATNRSEAPSCGRFETLLKERWALVVLMGGGAEVRRLAAAAGWPFLLVSDDAPLPASVAQFCVGRIGMRSSRALPDLVRECVRAGVRRVVQLRYDPDSYDATEALATAGIATETVHVGRQSSPAAVAQAALAEMRRLAARRPLPDLFLFTDDYLAQGGLLALAVAGVRVPEDVRVATHANKGLGPLWTRPLSRLEVDAAAHGRAIAASILAYLETGVIPPDPGLGSVWRKGETL